MLLALAWLSSCAGGADSAEVGDSEEAEAVVTGYSGRSVGQTPDGSYVADPETLLFRRTVDPGAATVTEEVWTEGARAWSFLSLVHAVDADAGTFTAVFVTDDGTLDVVGAFDGGEPWAWTAWHSTSTYRDGEYAGTRVESVDAVDGVGVIVATKEVIEPSGEATWLLEETLTPMATADFDAALAGIQAE